MKYLLLPLFLFITLVASGQISRGGHPLAYSRLKSTVPVIRLPSVDHTRAIRENFEAQERINGKKPFRFAENLAVSLNPGNAGQWTDEGNIRVWRLAIASENAYGLSVFFSRYHLNEGSMLFLYDPAQEKVLGGFNHQNNKSSGKLQTDFIPGPQLVLELQVEKGREYGELELGWVAHAFVDVFGKKDGRYGMSGDCNIDINCPGGDDWQVIKRSVVRIYIGSTREFCTGTLINNTRHDGKPFLLTANHCIKNQIDAESSVYYFGYESPTCDGGDGSVALSLSNSQILATSDSLDFTLVRLSETPGENYQPYYAGWSLSQIPAASAVTIHHPEGDVKKISFENHPLLTEYQSVNPPSWLYIGSVPGAFWRVGRWDRGTTEPGSSGAPLFNPLQLIVGNLTGGEAVCALPINDYFSKFYLCWNYYPEKTRNLAAWLDPEAKGKEYLNGYDPYNPNLPPPVWPEEKFRVWPQPSDGHITIHTDSQVLHGAEIRLYNTNGLIIGQFLMPATTTFTVDLSYLYPGMYILELNSGDLLERKKIIITK